MIATSTTTDMQAAAPGTPSAVMAATNGEWPGTSRFHGTTHITSRMELR